MMGKVAILPVLNGPPLDGSSYSIHANYLSIILGLLLCLPKKFPAEKESHQAHEKHPQDPAPAAGAKQRRGQEGDSHRVQEQLRQQDILLQERPGQPRGFSIRRVVSCLRSVRQGLLHGQVAEEAPAASAHAQCGRMHLPDMPQGAQLANQAARPPADPQRPPACQLPAVQPALQRKTESHQAYEAEAQQEFW